MLASMWHHKHLTPMTWWRLPRHIIIIANYSIGHKTYSFETQDLALNQAYWCTLDSLLILLTITNPFTRIINNEPFNINMQRILNVSRDIYMFEEQRCVIKHVHIYISIQTVKGPIHIINWLKRKCNKILLLPLNNLF